MDYAFSQYEINIKEDIGDAWSLEKGDKPIEVKVLFLGESALGVRGYKFHEAKICEPHKKGSLMT